MGVLIVKEQGSVQIAIVHVYSAGHGMRIKTISAIRSFILTFDLEMCVRVAREDALVW